MGEIPIIFLVFVLVWVAVIVCCRSFSSEDLYMSERARRREIILSQQQALRQCHLPIMHGRGARETRSGDFRVTPIRVTTISRGGGSINMDFYEIQLPQRTHSPLRSGTERLRDTPVPPPPFNTAYLVSSPVGQPEDVPPPTYEESLKSDTPKGQLGSSRGQKPHTDTEIHI